MKERPILFSAPMVRAILEGRKTQTRRVVKGPALGVLNLEIRQPTDPIFARKCHYGAIGDNLWVKETFAENIAGCETQRGLSYRADHKDPNGDGPANPMKWRPSIYMPRVASRITLEITGIRVERLQAITNNDALAEGTPDLRTIENNWDMVRCYQELWEQINGAGSWAVNPWVWVVEFKWVGK